MKNKPETILRPLMSKYDWKSNISANILTLRVVGLWPAGEDTYKFDIYMLYATFLLSFFLIGHILAQTVKIYFIRNNLEAVTAIIYVMAVELMVILKSYHLITNMGMLKELLTILNTEMFQPKNDTQLKAIDANIWFWKLIYKVFMTSSLLYVFWAVFPRSDETGANERLLPFLAWYPFDSTTSPFYEIIYIYQICCVTLFSIVHVTIDSLVAALNTFNASQFDILADNLRNLHRLEGNILTNFINCIEHHKGILSYSNKSNQFLNWILFVQFFVSALAIGMSMFQLSLMEPMSSQFFSFLSYVIAITEQTFTYCWFGNEVEIKSRTIPNAAFECDWTGFSEELKKDLLFFILRAQKPVKLSTLNLFYLSLDTFKGIMKTSWSYYALLHQVTLREE